MHIAQAALGDWIKDRDYIPYAATQLYLIVWVLTVVLRMTYWVIHRSGIFQNESGKDHLEMAKIMRISAKLRSAPKDSSFVKSSKGSAKENIRKLSLSEVLKMEMGFNAFMEHIMKEFSSENLLVSFSPLFFLLKIKKIYLKKRQLSR